MSADAIIGAGAQLSPEERAAFRKILIESSIAPNTTIDGRQVYSVINSEGHCTGRYEDWETAHAMATLIYGDA